MPPPHRLLLSGHTVPPRVEAFKSTAYPSRSKCIAQSFSHIAAGKTVLHQATEKPFSGRKRTRHQAAVLDRPSTSDSPEQTDVATSSEQEQYVWTKQWYAVTLTSALNPRKPNAIRLLGKELVLWKDEAGEWICMADKCSHRLAPLSEGRVENGNIMCAYHAWSFNSSGNLVDVPQAHHYGPDGNARACASRRGCVATFPVKVAQEMVFVWPESGAMAALEAANTKPVLSPYMTEQRPYKTMSGEPVYTVGKSFMRDVPLSFEHQMENLCDPAHFNPSHSEVAGDRRHEFTGMARIEELPVEGQLQTLFGDAKGVAGKVTMLAGIGRHVETSWYHVVMPGLFTLYTPKPKDMKGAEFELLHIHVTPTKPGHVRVFVHFYVAGKNAPLPLKIFPALVPEWYSHLRSLEIIDGDNTFLVTQDRVTREIEEQEGLPWYKSYYMPTNADKMLAEMRKWVDTIGGGGPFPGTKAPALIPKREALDRLNQHTMICPSCSGALRNFQALRVVLAIAAGVFTASGMAVAAVRGLTGGLTPLWFGAAAAACTALSLAANHYVKLLTFKVYEHHKH
ncbi:g1163 [Coccomyxa elongata]